MQPLITNRNLGRPLGVLNRRKGQKPERVFNRSCLLILAGIIILHGLFALVAYLLIK